MKQVAGNTLRDISRWKDIFLLWNEQKSECAYTGQELIPGRNASLDHKIPTSRGGSHSTENLQWIAYKINTMKYNMTHEEFVGFCLLVGAKFFEDAAMPPDHILKFANCKSDRKPQDPFTFIA